MPPESTLSVLYVEDSKIVRESTLLIMEEYFARVDVAENGAEGYEKYTQHYQEHGRYYDIVFTDLKMPRMDGIGLSEAILKEHAAQTIVVISAHDESEYLLSLINLGISSFILKPIDTEQFDKVVTQLSHTLQNERMLRIKQEELLEMNRRLIQAKKEAEQASMAKNHFLANMSHEIRTPLNAINGFIRLLSEEEEDPEKKNYLKIILDSSDSLLLIISDILDLSKIESGKFRLEKANFSPKESLVNVGKLFQAKAQQQGITLEVFCDEAMPDTLYSDALRIKQIAFNLLSNAIKFTQKGGKADCSIAYHDGLLILKVKDNGIGIPEEEQEHIFEPFSQVDDSTSRLFGGTGLGLSISIKLAHMLGGTLEVESDEGEGSTFTLAVPAPQSTRSASSLEKHAKSHFHEASTHKAHILIVEDNEANAMFVGIALKKVGMTYDVATNGLEAIAKFESEHYDLILMDENMPKLSGIGATKAILDHEKQREQHHTPIVALTANAISGDRERFLKAGMDGYLSKPIDPNVLITTICTFLADKKENT
jgi:signal transduction histidine kinase